MKILQSPNKILENKTQDVKEVNAEILELVEKMKSIKNGKKAVGLAANQIGSDYRIAVVGYTPEGDERESVPEIVFINPRITLRSNDKGTENEKCLSVGEKGVDVPRPKKIHVQYLDTNGKKQKMKARGFLARIIQHEIDHLDGKTILHYT